MFLVLGHCSVFTCHLREFFFIDTKLTWPDAQEYCRRNHSDLLTVYDMEDLRILGDSKIQKKDAWIGLERGSVDGENWKCSQPGVNKKTPWAQGQPNDREGRTQNCALIAEDGLHDYECEKILSFLCYNGEDCFFMNTHSLQYSLIAHAIESTCSNFGHYFFSCFRPDQVIFLVHLVSKLLSCLNRHHQESRISDR